MPIKNSNIYIELKY